MGGLRAQGVDSYKILDEDRAELRVLQKHMIKVLKKKLDNKMQDLLSLKNKSRK
jgi:hypothetical protein